MRFRARFFQDGRFEDTEVDVSQEELVTVYLNSLKFISLFVLPRDLIELAVGFVVTEGIAEYDEIIGVSVDGNRINVALKSKQNIDLLTELRSSGCSGVIQPNPPPVNSKKTFNAGAIVKSLNSLDKNAVEWKRTGGTHTACLMDDVGRCLKSFEDVGRHNALDKVVGWAKTEKQTLDDKFVLFSGRLSSGIVSKAARARIPMVVSNTSALSKAIEVAETLNITLVGFARQNRLTVYAGSWRVLS